MLLNSLSTLIWIENMVIPNIFSQSEPELGNIFSDWSKMISFMTSLFGKAKSTVQEGVGSVNVSYINSVRSPDKHLKKLNLIT